MEVFRQKNISLLSLKLKNLHTSVTCLAVIKWIYKWVFPKIVETPKIDGFIEKKPYEKLDDLGGTPPIFGNIQTAASPRISFPGLLPQRDS